MCQNGFWGFDKKYTLHLQRPSLRRRIHNCPIGYRWNRGTSLRDICVFVFEFAASRFPEKWTFIKDIFWIFQNCGVGCLQASNSTSGECSVVVIVYYIWGHLYICACTAASILYKKCLYAYGQKYVFTRGGPSGSRYTNTIYAMRCYTRESLWNNDNLHKDAATIPQNRIFLQFGSDIHALHGVFFSK